MAFVVNGFNIGQDLQVLIGPSQATPAVGPQPLAGPIYADQLGHLMDFNASWDDTEIKVIPITNGGMPLYDVIPHGLQGKLTFTRANGAIAGMFISIMQNFFNAQARAKFDITVQVANRDGSFDTYIFSNCSFSKHDFGTFRPDKEVEQSWSFRAQNLTVTSSATANLVIGLQAP